MTLAWNEIPATVSAGPPSRVLTLAVKPYTCRSILGDAIAIAAIEEFDHQDESKVSLSLPEAPYGVGRIRAAKLIGRKR